MRKSIPNISVIEGNIFTTQLQTIVNTINCVGVMGAGIALEFKLRYPEMFNKYKKLCDENLIKVGSLWLYIINDKKKVLNFPTKMHWKDPSRIEYLEKGLIKFLETYKDKNITSIAFPVLGASKGNIDEKVSLGIMTEYLSKCDIPVEIYRYDPFAYDDLYKEFRQKFTELNSEQIKIKTKLRTNYISKIKEALENDAIRSLSRLATVEGIGAKTLEKAFDFAMRASEEELTLNL